MSTTSKGPGGIPYRYQKLIAAALPLLGVAAAVALVLPRYQALQADREELQRVEASVRAKQEAIDSMKLREVGPIVARVPASRDERVTFLRNLNAVATICGVRLPSITATAPELPAAEQKAPSPLEAQKTDAKDGQQGQQQGALPPGTVPTTLEITAEGTYHDMALFFARLENYPRLIAVSGVTMKSTNYPQLTSNFRLTRYTGPPEAPRPANADAGAAGSPAPPGAGAIAASLDAKRATVTSTAAGPDAGAAP